MDLGRTKGVMLLVQGTRTFANPWNRSFPEALGYGLRFAFRFVKVNRRERDWVGVLGTVVCVSVRGVGKGAAFGILYRSLHDIQVCCFHQGHLSG